MMVKTLRTTAWLLGVAIMSLALTGQPALAGHNSSPTILSVAVDFNLDQLTVTGTNFVPDSTDPNVSLAGVALTVDRASDVEIVVDCPLDTATASPLCVDGDFLLKVTTVKNDDDGDRETKTVTCDLTIGPTGFVTDADLAALGAQINANVASIANLGAQINTNVASIANLGAQINANAASIANLGAQINTNQASIANLGAQFNDLASRVAELEDDD